MKALGFIHEETAMLRRKHLFREMREVEAVLPGGRIRMGGKEILNLSSNNYLGLANSELLCRKSRESLQRFGTSACASRLITGNLSLHRAVEEEVASWLGTEAAVLYNTGYMGNLGVISALMGRGDVILSDKLNHASIVDGVLLSGARFRRYPHADMDKLEDFLRKDSSSGKRLIVTDTVFSVDGDLAPLKEIAYLKERYGAILMVDEAHGGGVFGPGGRGVAEMLDLRDAIDVHLGTFSKAFGSYGAYVAGSRKLADYLVNRSRAFIYSTSLPPAVLGANLAAIAEVKNGADLRSRLHRNATHLRQSLKELGFDTLASASQIVPVLVGDNRKALEFTEGLLDQGILAVALRPPTVPAGTARLRLSVTAEHGPQDLDSALSAITEAGRVLGVI